MCSFLLQKRVELKLHGWKGKDLYHIWSLHYCHRYDMEPTHPTALDNPPPTHTHYLPAHPYPRWSRDGHARYSRWKSVNLSSLAEKCQVVWCRILHQRRNPVDRSFAFSIQETVSITMRSQGQGQHLPGSLPRNVHSLIQGKLLFFLATLSRV